MSLLRKTIISLIPFAVEMGVKKSQTPKNIALKLLGAVLFGIGAIFGLIALHQFLCKSFSPPEVNLQFAGGFAVLGLVCFAIVFSRAKSRHKPTLLNASSLAEIPEGIKNTAQSAVENAARLQKGIKQNLHNHTGTYLLGAAVLGLLLGARTRGKKVDDT